MTSQNKRSDVTPTQGARACGDTLLVVAVAWWLERSQLTDAHDHYWRGVTCSNNNSLQAAVACCSCSGLSVVRHRVAAVSGLPSSNYAWPVVSGRVRACVAASFSFFTFTSQLLLLFANSCGVEKAVVFVAVCVCCCCFSCSCCPTCCVSAVAVALVGVVMRQQLVLCRLVVATLLLLFLEAALFVCCQNVGVFIRKRTKAKSWKNAKCKVSKVFLAVHFLVRGSLWRHNACGLTFRNFKMLF